MDGFFVQLIVLVDGTKLSVLAAMIFANLLTGIATSVYSRTFRLKAVADFLVTRVLPYLLSYMAIGAVGVFEPAWRPFIAVVWGLIIAALAGAILANLREMGVKLPDILAGEKEG